MSTNCIDFKGLFHGDQILNLKRLQKKEFKGIYVWGFVYNRLEEKILEPVKYSTQEFADLETPTKLPDHQVFIPYYVGIDKSLHTFSRLFSHMNPQGNLSKYIQFEKSFMKSFFEGTSKFPVHYGKTFNNLIAQYSINNPKTISYFNDLLLLQKLYPNVPLSPDSTGNIPITSFPIGTGPNDELKDLIINKNNFWFCFAEVDTSIKLSDAEASTYWSLKGLTISKIKKNATAIPLTAQPSCQSIFKNLSLNNLPTIYNVLHANPLIFPGY